MDIRAQLEQYAEPAYRDFSAKLIPGCDEMLGIRLPTLRRIAKEIARGDWRHFLAEAGEGCYEEVMLQGMVLGCVAADAQELLGYVAAFLPKITNWSVCDSFCAGFRLAEREPEAVWAFFAPLFQSEQTYEARAAVVMALTHFLTPDYLDDVLARLETVRHEDRYVKMAVAWALSVAFVKDRGKTLAALQQGAWDDWTYNKAIAKCIESRRVSDGDKAMLRAMRRTASRPAERPAQRTAEEHGTQAVERAGHDG